MKDIAPELYEKLISEFSERMEADPSLAAILEKLAAGDGTYIDAAEYADTVGELLASVFGDNISEEILPDGKMYFNIAQRTVRPMMEEGQSLVADVCEKVQGNLNQAAGINIKPIRPALNDDRISGIVNRLSSEEHYDKVSWILDEPVKTFSRSTVDDSIKANADFQGKAGLKPRIVREAMAGCCEWCVDIAGSYRYPDVPKDVYRRHNNCRCTVDYDPGSGLLRGKTQNVHTKEWETAEEREARVARNRIQGLDTGNSRDKIEQRKIIGLGNEYTRRRIGDQGQEIIDKATYNKVTSDFLKTGGVIIRGEEAKKHLESVNAYAAFSRGGYYAYIRDDATVSDVLEEMFHAKQERSGIYSDLSDYELHLRREIDAQKYLLSVSEKYKIPEEETELTKKNLLDYQEKLESFLRGD